MRPVHRGKAKREKGYTRQEHGVPWALDALTNDDDGRFTRLIPQENIARIYTDQWHVARMR